MKTKQRNTKRVKPANAAPVQTTAQIKKENLTAFLESKKNDGRPTDFTEELADEICDQLMEGKTLLDIVNDNPNMPRRATIYKWMERYATFNDKILRARKSHAMSLTDSIAAIGEELYKQCENAQDVRNTNDRLRAMTEIAKVRIGANQWRASRYNPGVLGDHIKYEGKVETNATVTTLECSDEALQARLTEIITTAQQRSESDAKK